MTGFMLNACFPSGSLEFWYMLIRKYLHDQHTIKALVAELLNRLPWQKRCVHYCVSTAGDALCDCSGEEESRRKPA